MSEYFDSYSRTRLNRSAILTLGSVRRRFPVRYILIKKYKKPWIREIPKKRKIMFLAEYSVNRVMKDWIHNRAGLTQYRWKRMDIMDRPDQYVRYIRVWE